MYEDKHALLSLNLNLGGWRPRAAEDCYVKSERRPKKKKKKCNLKKQKADSYWKHTFKYSYT